MENLINANIEKNNAFSGDKIFLNTNNQIYFITEMNCKQYLREEHVVKLSSSGNR